MANAKLNISANNEREDDEAREIAQNAGALRELGFPCRDAEDDHDF
jgi:hypothetical protein